MGSATAYQLAKRGNQVLGLDQFSPPHIFGSTHGDTRITRQAIGEGEEYVPLVLRSYEIWEDIEKETDNQVLFKVGGLIMSGENQHSARRTGFLETTIKAAQRYGIEHELLSAGDIRRRFPQFKVTDQDQGYFEKNAGYVIPELAVASQLTLAKKYGAEIKTNEKVVNWDVSDSGAVTVTTDQGIYQANQLIITAGPWIIDLLTENITRYFKIYRQVLYWFEIAEKDFSLFSPPQMPIFIWEYGNENDDAIYGFPAIDGPTGGVKVASEQYSVTTDPDNVKRDVDPAEIMYMYDHFLKDRLPALKPDCVKAVSCLYTVTPDSAFVIDRHPQYNQVIIGSPCSGHGFKHSAAIGEVLAEMAMTGKSTIDISAFGFARLKTPT